MTDAPSRPQGHPRPVPGRPRTVRLPTVLDERLESGLRVVLVRRPTVPMVEVRVRMPVVGASPRHGARAVLLGEALLAGTQRRSGAEVAAAVQATGGTLHTDVDSDRLLLAGSTLSEHLGGWLDVVADVLTGAAFPADPVARARERLVQELAIARSQPAVMAEETLLRRMYGRHPYAAELPQPDDVAEVSRSRLARLHHRKVRPDRATLIMVGDLSPARTLEQVRAALQGWEPGGRSITPVPALPSPPGGLTFVDRPGASQSTVRLGARAPSRTHPDHPAMVLANLVLGGYFSSRLVDNLRERRGYTYSPSSAVLHPLAGSRVVLATDVATAVTAASLVETRYELGRMATTFVTDDELTAARRYATGTLALAIGSQAGLATTLSRLVAEGLDVTYLRTQPKALAAVDPERVRAVAATYLAPQRWTGVVVGDAAGVRDEVGAVEHWGS